MKNEKVQYKFKGSTDNSRHYLEISTDGPTNLEPYFASVYTKPNKAKSVIKDIKALGLKAVYPVEYTNENLLTKILINFLAIIFISEVSVYLIGIFFIVFLFCLDSIIIFW